MGVAKKIKSILLVATVSLVQLCIPQSVAAAGSASLTLSPSSGSYVKGSTLSVSINVTSSDLVNAVQADLTYDTAKLQYVNVDGTGSAFDFPLSATGGGGSVQIARGVSGGGTVSGTKKFASVNFTVLASGATASITFASSSAVLSPGGSGTTNVWNGNTTGGTYTLTAPADPAPPASGSSGSGSGAAGGSKNPTPAPAAKPQQPAAPSQPASPEQPVATVSPSANTNYLVAIKVVDKSNNAKKAVEVRLNDVKVKTDDKGIASFTDVPVGTYTVTAFTSKDASVDMTIEVKPGDTTAAQSFTFTIPVASSKMWLYVAGGALMLAAAGGGAFLFLVRKRKPSFTPSYSAASAVTGSFNGGTIAPVDVTQPGQQLQAPPETIIRPTVQSNPNNPTDEDTRN